SVDQPAHGNFIIAPNAPYDWRAPQNANLWQGINGVNNPCPSGYRIPTEQELNNERLSWSSPNTQGAFSSNLKLTLAGYRYYNSGGILLTAQEGFIWSSNINSTGTASRYLDWGNNNSDIFDAYRVFGMSVRCIKETVGSVGALNCNGTTLSGGVYANQAILGTTANVPYTSGNGGYIAAQTLNSTGVTGITATLSQGLLANGAGTLAFALSGTPSGTGTATFALTIGGQSCSFTVSVQSFASITINTNDTLCAGQSTTLTANAQNAGTPCAAPGLSGTLTNGLVGYWPFCGNANDLSGNANHGTVNGATLSTDRFGTANSAYSFNGNSRIRIPFTNSFSSTTGTVSAWINLTALPPLNDNQHLIFGKGWGYPQLLVRDDGKIYLSIANATNSFTVISSNSILVTSNWYFITAQYSSSNLRLYINGILDNSINVASGFYSFCNSEYFIGGFNHVNSCIPNDNVQNINGKLDDIGIWNRALTQQEITQLYQQGQATYLWSNGATTPSITVSPTQTTTYTCTVTMNGVSTTQSQTITVNALPTVTATANQTVCAGTSVTLNGSGASSYSWNNGISNGVAFTPNSTTTYTVTGTDANGCTNTAQTTVTVNALPAANITAQGATTFCQNNSVTLNANSGAGFSYQWYNNGSAINGANSATLPVSNAGSYTVQVTNANNCSQTSAATSVTVNALPAATITPASATTFCQGGSVVLNGNVGQGLSYQWNLNGSPINGANAASYTANASGNYSLDVLNSDGCSATSTVVSVTVNALPTVSAGANQTLCAGTAITLSGSGASSYTWNNGVSNGVAFTPVSTQTYTVTGTNANGCTNTAQVTVTVNALPTPTISYVGSPILCQGSTLALNSSAGSSYLWSNGQTTQSIQVTQGGAYTVQVTNANGCIGTSNPVNITVNPLPAPSITAQGPTTFCQGGSVVLTSTGATSYAWSTNATTQSITVTTSGLYQVTVVDNKGCSGSSSPIQVTVLSPPNASITTIGSTALCAGQSTSLSAPAGNTYLWSNGASTQNITVNTAGTYSVQVTNAAGCSANSNVVTISVNPVPVANISANGATSFCTGGSVVLTASAGASYLWNTGATTQSITVNSSGTFNVTVTGAGGCNATSAATSVTVNALPTASITASGNTTFCAGNSVLLSASNGSSYLWSNGATTPSISATAAGSYSVSVTNGAGCTATSTPVQITVNPLPTVSAGANQSICAGGQVTLNGSGATSYAWNNGVTNGVAFTPSNTQTYTVTGTNANGCSNTAQVTVTVNALPTVSAGTNQSICAGSQVTLMGSGANTYAWNNGVTNGVAFTPANTQTYTVTGTNTNGCSNTAQVTVTVNALPTASISASGSTTLCAGSSVNLSASNGSSYLWSNGATTQTITASTAGNYSVQVTNAAGCSATSSIVNVVVNPLPAANITANGSTTFCAGGSVVLSATAGASYLWNTGATTQTLTVNTSGTYTVTVTSNNGCVGTSSPQTVTVSAQPSTSITANGATSFCAGGSVLLSAPNGGTYLWSTGATTPSISVSTAGSYSVTVTNGAGCSATSTPTTITVNPLPSVSAGANQSVCSGSQVTLNGSGATSYAWNNGVTNGVAFTPGTTQTYTVTGTDANGCSNNAQVTITVNALPAVSAGANQSICAGNQITLNGSGASSYTWNNGVTNGVAFTPANTQTYTVTGTNANGCSNTAQVTVTVNALPTANAGSNALINCVNNPNGATLGAAPQAGFTYQWSPATGLSSATLANPVANPINSTTYTLTVTQTSTGCSNTASVNVTVNTSAPQANAGQNSSITCVANTNGVNIGSNPSAGLTYAWTPSTGLSASNISNPVANPLLTTTYTLTITNTSNGCTGTGTVTVSVNNTAPTVNAGQDQTVCAGQSVTLNATGANTYVWNNGAIQGVAFTPSSTQTYTVQGTNTVNGCTSTDQVIVTLNALPTVSAGTNQTVCAGTAVTLTGTGASSYAWNNGVSNGVAFSPTNTQTYTVTGTDANGCSNTAQVTVTVNALPVVSAGANQSICAGTAVTLSGSGATNYTWNNGVSNGVAFTPTNTQTYTVIGTNANGCQGTAQVTVTVNAVPTPTLVANGTAPYCPGTNVVLSTPSLPGHTYQWYFGQNIINGATASTYTATTAGTYY
ncbi:MAG: LamG-like jellyroll fold domain-containing protein, partial [Flavobacteriales bacterium]